MEEEKEFETFKRGRGKTLCHIWNLYPYSSVTNPIYLGKLRRGQSSQTSLFKKAKKEARQKRLPLHPASTCTRPQSQNITEFPSLPENVPSKDLPTKETPPKRPPTDSSEISKNLLRDFTGHTWWFRRGRGTRNSICFPMCLYRSLLSHQPQSRLSQWKPYGNTPSQTQQRRMTYRILWLSGPLPLHSETE